MALQNEIAARFYNAFEFVTKAIKVIDTDHAYIHQKKKYSSFIKQSISAGGTLVFCLKTPATNYIHYRPMGINPSADKVDIQVYEDAVFTAATGTLLVATNRNRNTPLVSAVELRTAPTVTTTGTLLEGLSDWLPGSTGVGQSRAGGEGGGGDEVVLKQNATYRIVIINGSPFLNHTFRHLLVLFSGKSNSVPSKSSPPLSG